MNNWFLLYMAPRGKGLLPSFPEVGDHVVHFLGQDPDRLTKDKQNQLWDKIQDGARPAWAPDLLRLGYAVVFRVDGAPALMKRLKVVSPSQKTKDDELVYDDVWVVQCEPWSIPFYCPATKLSVEDWWSATENERRPDSPYLSPKGATVTAGAMRLCDLVAMRSQDPEHFPFQAPPPYKAGKMPQNPMVPVLPRVWVDPLEHFQPGYSQDGYGSTGSIQLFRY